ncbi:MAG TPA: tryptophan 2,3-dioxygenase family protein [Acidimicrobiia bacterium]|nr:tryptophan 2,3-dioxygenase family protein [Acidimicrobiia bacterium]
MSENPYAEYLALGPLLSQQHPVSREHDEVLFIVIHQATELWMKLVLHEVGYARDRIEADDLGPAFKALARVSRIQHVLIESWQVLSTMTPTDYLEFRHMLGNASGFQSEQYRAIEFMFGRRPAGYLGQLDEAGRTRVEGIRHAPSLYDETLRLLARRGLLGAAWLERDWTRQHELTEEVVAVWETVYRDPTRYWDLYELAEKLVDLEHAFSRWRYEHYRTVHRIIGGKRGTGGTEGLAYLRKAVDFVFFPELWEVRSRL